MVGEGAKKRVELVAGHLEREEPNSRRKRSKPRRKDQLPADWSDVQSELDHVRKLAQTPKADTTGYIRHKQAGKLWVRERIELLLDRNSFREVGSAAGTAVWLKPDGVQGTREEREREKLADFTPSNNVQGKLGMCCILPPNRLTIVRRLWQSQRSHSPCHS